MNKKPILIAGILVIVGISTGIIFAMYQQSVVPQRTFKYPTTNLFGMNMMVHDEYVYIDKILSGVELECYAVNFYNATADGRFVYYDTMLDGLRANMADLTLRPNLSENITAKFLNATVNIENISIGRFLDNAIVKAYYEVNCRHLASEYDIPDDYNADIGTTAFEMCFERKYIFTDLKCTYLLGTGSPYNIVFEFQGDFEKYLEIRNNTSSPNP